MEPQDTSGAERRTEPRYAAKFEVHFGEATDAARAFRAYSLNVSGGGICLKVQKHYDIGQVLQLALEIQGQPFKLHGVVAWVRRDVIGVRFQDVAPDARERLMALLEQSGTERM